MADNIQLLPDHIANQIAAGEVVQRPASALKELLENAIDAGASDIRVIFSEAGKDLLQVIDNGSGMSITDARMSFERHATSKIRSTEDLFSIRTLGFRGEALASIGAVAQVELKTRLEGEELGTHLVIEGGTFVKQEPCSTPVGTSIIVKNLFFNVPARRNFLKSTKVELRHLYDEFYRVALANPSVSFSVFREEEEVYHLNSGTLRQRIVGLLGNKINDKLVPLEEETDLVEFKGFISKPEYNKRQRGEQYLFVNGRYIKSPYLNHAIMLAYSDFLPSGSFPMYAIFLKVNPEKVDVNVHPTKQEVKFENEREFYNYLRVAVKHALGKHHAIPSLDFDMSSTLLGRSSSYSGTSSGGSFSSGSASGTSTGNTALESSNIRHWEKIYEGLEESMEQGPESLTLSSKIEGEESDRSHTKWGTKPYQIHQSYIVSPLRSGFLLIDQQFASQRILFEEYLRGLTNQARTIQKELFPETLHFSPSDADILKQVLEDINALGFDLQEFGKDTFVLHGIPGELDPESDKQQILDSLVSGVKQNLDLKKDYHEELAHQMSFQSSLKKNTPLSVDEMQELIDKLFACENPQTTFGGKKCFITFELDSLEKQFQI